MNVARKMEMAGDVRAVVLSKHGFYAQGLPKDLPWSRRLLAWWLELALQVRKAFTGTLASAGVLVLIKTILLSLTATLTTAGALLKRTATAKGGTLTTAGALTRQIGKAMTGALTAAGAVLSNLNGLVINFVRLVNVRGIVARLSSLVGRNPGLTDIQGK